MSTITSCDVMVREKLITRSTIQTLEIENSQLNNKVSLLLWQSYNTVYGKASMGGNFHSVSLNCESFPMNHDLVDQQCKSMTMLQQTNSHFLFKIQVFPYRFFAIFGISCLFWQVIKPGIEMKQDWNEMDTCRLNSSRMRPNWLYFIVIAHNEPMAEIA